MAEFTKYEYTINDFPNLQVDSGRLFLEISESDIEISLDRIDTNDGYINVWFKAALSTSSPNDVLNLNNIISVHSGLPLPLAVLKVEPVVKTNSDGIPIYTNEPRVGQETIYASNNFCDKSSWYGGSVRITDETLTDSGDGYTFYGVNQFWIDMYTGRVLNDDGLVEQQIKENPSDPHGWQVVIKINGVEATQCEPLMHDTGDYQVYYEDGYIKFHNSQAGKTITASYSRAAGSVFILKPIDGKLLNIEAAEADFSTNIEYNDTIFYTAYGFVDYFAPQYLIENGGPFPPGTRIPLRTRKYKRYGQILREAVGSYPTLESNCAKPEHLGLSDKDFRHVSRGTQYSSVAIPFRYGTITKLQSSLGLELHIGLEHDIVFGGETATITLYCTSQDE